MSWVLLIAGVCAAGAFVYGADHCFGRHDPMVTQRRDADGHVRHPHTLVWVCTKCHREVGRTTLPVNWRRLMSLRFQAETLRMEADAERKRA